MRMLNSMAAGARRNLSALLSLCASFVHVSSAVAADAAPLALESRIALGDIVGRIDHLAYDPRRQRVYVAELGNNSIGIVDLKARQRIRTVTGFEEPQGIAYEPSTDTVYVANAGDGSVRVFSGTEFAPLATIPLGDDADNVRIDQITHRVYVGYGSGALAIIDPLTRKKVGDVDLKGHPESFQLEAGGNRVFVNVPDAGEIAVVGRDVGKQMTSWPSGNLRANYPLALDASNERVLSVFRTPARLQSFEMRSGRKLGGIDVCKDSDDVFIDASRHRVYVVCGEGYVDVIDTSGETYTRVSRVKTSRGSRTGLFATEPDRLLIAIRASGAESAALWVLRPEP